MNCRPQRILSVALSAVLAFAPLTALAEDISASVDDSTQLSQGKAPLDEVVQPAPSDEEQDETIPVVEDTPAVEPLPEDGDESDEDAVDSPISEEQMEQIESEDPAALEEEEAAPAPDDTSLTAASDSKGRPSASYLAHVQNIGWQSAVKDGEIAGTSGRALRMEAIKVSVALPSGVTGGVEYQSHVQNIGWMEWVKDGALSGTSGRSLRVEAFRMKLYGDAAKHYDIYYRVHVQNIGWMGWVKNGELSGTTGRSLRMEAVQVLVVPKGDSAPGVDGSDAFGGFPVGGSLSVQSHVQNIGWQAAVGSGVISGTTGRSLRVESFKLNVSGAKVPGGVRYCSHVQNVGWQGWVSNGAVSGTTGRSLRVEAIRAELTGELAAYYDLYYRVHVQDIGWMGWAKNGEAAGTAGRSARIEAFQFNLVPKGDTPPSNSGAATKMHFLVGVSYGFEGLKTYVLTASSCEGAGESSALKYRFTWKRQGESSNHVIRNWSDARTAKLTVDDIQAKEGTYVLTVEQKDAYGNTYSSSKSVYYKPSTGTFQDLLDVASKDIGYYVGNDPETGSKFGRWYEEKVDKNTRNYDYGEDDVAYCVMAVSYWMDMAKVFGPGLPRAGCEGVYFAALEEDRTVSPTSIQPGMLILYDWDGDKLPDHIGIVEKRINSTTYQTIEGNTFNTSAGSQDNGGWVARRTRTIEDGILCGVVPYYS